MKLVFGFVLSYPVIEKNFRLVSHTFVPKQPHGVIDDERGEQIAVNVDPGTLQTLPENTTSKVTTE
jgi:hypothetical protein